MSEAPPEALAAEIADLLEVLASLQEQYGLDEDQLRRVQDERLRERGGFARRLRLLWTEEFVIPPVQVSRLSDMR